MRYFGLRPWLVGAALFALAPEVVAETEAGAASEPQLGATKKTRRFERMEEKRRFVPQARDLGEHLFVMPSLVTPTFMMTYFSLRQGLAYGSIEDDSNGESASLLGFAQRFRLGVRLRPWWGLSGGFEGQVSSGVDPDSILSHGAKFDGTGYVGTAFRLFRREDWGTQFAAHLRYRSRFGRTILPSQAIDGLSEDMGTDDDLSDLEADLWVERSSHSADLVLSGAQRIHRNVGLAVSIQGRLGGASYTRSEPEGDNKTKSTQSILSFAAQLSSNLHPWAPLSFALEYRHQATFDAIDEDIDNLQRSRGTGIFGMYFSGERNLVLGLTSSYLFRNLSGLSQQGFLGEFVFDYVFR